MVEEIIAVRCVKSGALDWLQKSAGGISKKVSKALDGPGF
jgi:hypothetical protein